VRLGLRGRFVAVLALISALTLAVAAVGLLSPLDRLLRKDALRNLNTTVGTEVSVLARLSSDHVRPHDATLQRLVRTLRRRSGGDAAILGDNGRMLASSDPDPHEPFAGVAAALRTRTTQSQITGAGSDVEAQVATPVTVDDVTVVLAARKHLDDVRAVAAVVRRAFLAAAAAGLIGALLVGLLLAGRLSSRIRRLRDTAERVAQVGPGADFTPEGGHDEIGDLSRTFAVMQHRLREQEGARRAFVATASHELRTPLSSLQLMLDMLIGDLEAEPVAVDDARRQARDADEQVSRLSQLSAELLDLSHLDAGVPLRDETVDVREVMQSVVSELGVRLDEQHREIDVATDGPRWAVGDPGAVARIARILLDNALRHTPPPGHVHAEVAGGADGMVGIVVEDDGPGVPPEDRDRIFERFARGRQAQPGGFGLGLAIGRELARRMGGDLVLEDTAAGARFALWLPAATTP
jgi:signal transduction histidine kinase